MLQWHAGEGGKMQHHIWDARMEDKDVMKALLGTSVWKKHACCMLQLHDNHNWYLVHNVMTLCFTGTCRLIATVMERVIHV